MPRGDLATSTKRPDADASPLWPVRHRLAARLRRLPPSTRSILIIVGIVLVGNVLFLAGLANNDPISWTSGIAHSVCGLVCGRSSTDINVGVITQPLGHLSAMDILHGHLPWWNSFEGLGQPLAGEMQSSALFPLVVLFALPGGLVWFHVVLEVVAGLSTYFLIRRLGVRELFAIVAGALFALNGTFSWLANSVVNPVAFLPMLLLGIEIVIAHAPSASRRGWYVMAAAAALSIYAGFPEVAYLDGLFCVAWAAVRLKSVPRQFRVRALRRLGLGAVGGVGVSLPALVAFGDYLHVAYLGRHVTAGGSWSLSLKALPMLFDPYLYGTIYGNAHVFTTWGEIGGYFGASVCVLAIVGLFGSRLRGLRVLLALWVMVGLMGAFDLLHVRALWNLLPLLSSTSMPRYIMPSSELAVIVLGTLGLQDLASREHVRRRFTRATLIMASVLVAGGVAAHELNYREALDTKNRIFLICLGLVPFVGVVVLLVGSRFMSRLDLTFLASAVLVIESLLFFMTPSIDAPRSVSVDDAPIHYLQTHQGEERFLDLSVLPPNWGSEFGLNALNATDLPFPRSFKTFIQQQLYPGLKPADAFTRDRTSGIVDEEAELATHLRSYEDASVKYVLAPRSLTLSPALSALGVTAVWHDALATIYVLPHPRPYFSSTCGVTSQGVNAAAVTCPHSSARLLRTELSMPGWSATVNGKSVSIHTVDGVYQSVELPKGTSEVRFNYIPPHEDLAIALGGLAALFLVGSLLHERRLRSRQLDGQWFALPNHIDQLFVEQDS
jgi:hypothetical protein